MMTGLVSLAILLAAIGAAVAVTTAVMRRQIQRQTCAADVIVALNSMLQNQVDELQQRFREVEMLSEMSELLQTSMSIDEACQVLPAFGSALFPNVSGSVFFARTAPGLMQLVASWNASGLKADFPTTDCWALRRAQPHAGTAGGIRCPHIEELSGATLCVPMLALGEAVGVLTLNASDTAVLPGHVERFARGFADQISFAIANLRLQETLRTRAVRDPLTGLYNRRYMQEVLARELQRASGDHQVGLIIADIDYFKQFNDRHGHTGGDALLQQFGRLMQTTVRDEDIVCRYGGEEFLIVLPGVGLDVLRRITESLIEGARRLRAHDQGAELTSITVSAGIALSHERLSSAADLIASADRALYNAKSAGRDRFAGPLPQIVGIDAA